MAYVDLVPAAVPLTYPGQGVPFQFALAPKNSAGTGVDLSTWDNTGWVMTVVPAAFSMDEQVFSTSPSITFISASAGKAVFTFNPSLSAGNYKYSFYGRPTSGDPYQVLSTGGLAAT